MCSNSGNKPPNKGLLYTAADHKMVPEKCRLICIGLIFINQISYSLFMVIIVIYENLQWGSRELTGEKVKFYVPS